MMNYLKRLLPLLILSVIGFGKPEISPGKEISCLVTSDAIGYEYRYEEYNPSPLFDFEISDDWTPQLENAIPKDGGWYPTYDEDIIATGEVVWVSAGREVYKYEISTGNTEIYDVSKFGYNLDDLLLTDSGELWGVLTSFVSKGSPIIRYNEKLDEFEGVEFFDREGNLLVAVKNVNYVNENLLEKSENELWLLHQNKLMVLNTSEKTAILELDLAPDYIIQQIALGPDEQSLWVFANDQSEGVLVYFYKNKQLEIVADIPVSFFGINTWSLNTAVDLQGRVWISNNAWIEIPVDLEKQEITYETVRLNKLFENPLFIGKHHNFSQVYYPASVVNVFSDGSIWFSSDPGLVRLQPETGEWCLVARGVSSDVAEGPDGSIWFAFEGQLYKHEP